jgi:predicted nucleic acid-binding protein
LSIILDTSVVVALYDDQDAYHAAARAWLLQTDEDLITTPLALAEMDHMIHREGGAEATARLHHDLDVGAIGVRWWSDALSSTLAVVRRHPFLGLVDASLVALSGPLRTTRIATFDEHFRSVLTPGGEAFVVLPTDA